MGRLVLVFALIATLVACAPRPHLSEEGNTVAVYFGRAESSDCSRVYPAERFIPATDALLEATLWELFQGPTAAEQADMYTSIFSEKTADLLISAPQAEGMVYVNLRDLREELSEVSSSCGSSAFMAAIEKTAQQFPGVKEVRYAIEGNPETFYEWVQLGCAPDSDICDPAPFGG